MSDTLQVTGDTEQVLSTERWVVFRSRELQTGDAGSHGEESAGERERATFSEVQG